MLLRCQVHEELSRRSRASRLMAVYVYCDREEQGCTSRAINGSPAVNGWIQIVRPFPVDDSDEGWSGIFCSYACAIEALQQKQEEAFNVPPE